MDFNFFEMWGVRPVGDKDYNSPRLFHFVFREDADALQVLLNKAHCAVPNR